MRKIISYFALCLFFISCTEKVADIVPAYTTFNTVNDFRTYDEALSLAKGCSPISSDTRSGKSNTYRINTDSSYVICPSTTRSAQGDAFNHDTLMYVFNFSDNEGFVIISANKATPGLIALSEDGNYNPNAAKSNPGLEFYMDLAEDYIRSSRTIVRPPYISNSDTIVEAVLPLLDTKWGQSDIFGTYCPNNICGCVPLALLELLSYYQYPTSIQLTYLGSNAPTISLNWEEMNMHKKKHLPNPINGCNNPNNAHQHLGQLAREIGHRANATYDDDETGVLPIDIIPTGVNMGYLSNGYISYHSDSAKDALDNHHPLLFLGYNSRHEGHAWIVDGYLRHIITRTIYNIDSRTTETVTNYYNHINWGWDGMNNGYFLDDVFNTATPYRLDYGSSNVANFNFDIYVRFTELYPSE